MKNEISSSEENKEMSELESLKKEVEKLKNKVNELEDKPAEVKRYRPKTGAEKAAAYKARWKARM